MASVRGNYRRRIQKPGNHITPKYDLYFLRKRKFGEDKKEEDFQLPLTSMIDMFSMLVIFLIMNFSSTGEIFFISKGVKLPETKFAANLQSKPLLSISGDKVFLDAKNVGSNPLSLIEDDLTNMPQLKDALRRIKAFEQSVNPNKPFKGEVNVQADEKTQIVYIKRVMNTLISEGWTGINFATRSSGSAGGSLLDQAEQEEEEFQ